MKKIIMLNDDLESQMRMYLTLNPQYRIDIAENEVILMRMLRRKKPKLLMIDASYRNPRHQGRSFVNLVEKIKQKYNRLFILTVVDDDTQKLIPKLKQLGVEAWIDRTAEADTLLERVNELLDYKMPIESSIPAETA